MRFAEIVFPQEAADAMAERVARVVQRDQSGVLKLKRLEQWIAVPTEGSCHLNDPDKNRLVRAYATCGHDRVYAVRIEELLDEPAAFALPTTFESLDEMDRHWGSFNYVLCPWDVSSVVICSTDDFTVYAGQIAFVEQALDTQETRGFEAFRAYGERIGEIWPRMPPLVEQIYWALADDYPKAEPGEWVQVPRLESKDVSHA